jgi:hypothetical protein
MPVREGEEEGGEEEGGCWRGLSNWSSSGTL